MSLEEEFQYYIDHQTELAEKYNGKIVVIKSHEVLGTYNDIDEAIAETGKEHELGTFLVQRCSPDPSSVTLTYHSRVRPY